SLLDTERELLLQQFTDAQETLVQMQQVESALSASNVDASLISSLSSRTDNVVVREMQLRLLELLAELNRVTTSSGPAHPRVIGLKEQVRNMQQNLIEAIANEKSTTQTRLTDISSRLESLNAT